MGRFAQTHHEWAHNVLDSYGEVSICKELMSLQEDSLIKLWDLRVLLTVHSTGEENP